MCHYVKYHRRCSSFHPDIGLQLHHPVGFASHQPDGSHIIQSESRNGILEKTQKRHFRFTATAYNDMPRQGIDEVDEQPQKENQRQIDACTPQISPEFPIIHIESEDHNQNSHHPKEQKQIAVFIFHLIECSCSMYRKNA